MQRIPSSPSLLPRAGCLRVTASGAPPFSYGFRVAPAGLNSCRSSNIKRCPFSRGEVSMKRVLAVLLIVVCAAVPALAAEKGKLTTEKEKLGYSIGYVSGMNLKQDGVDVSAEQLARGVRDGLGVQSCVADVVAEGTLHARRGLLGGDCQRRTGDALERMVIGRGLGVRQRITQSTTARRRRRRATDIAAR